MPEKNVEDEPSQAAHHVQRHILGPGACCWKGLGPDMTKGWDGWVGMCWQEQLSSPSHAAVSFPPLGYRTGAGQQPPALDGQGRCFNLKKRSHQIPMGCPLLLYAGGSLDECSG